MMAAMRVTDLWQMLARLAYRGGQIEPALESVEAAFHDVSASVDLLFEVGCPAAGTAFMVRRAIGRGLAP